MSTTHAARRHTREVERPRSDLDAELDQVIETHAVGLRNKSFGKPSRAVIEQSLMDAGCGELDLTRNLAVRGELDAAYEARQPRQANIETVAAGNDGLRVVGPQDQKGCRVERPASVVVGSYGTDFSRAEFSNFGGCVDVLPPGEDVTFVLPDGWLMPMLGTSYSAPLVAGWVSRWTGPAFPQRPSRLPSLVFGTKRFAALKTSLPWLPGKHSALGWMEASNRACSEQTGHHPRSQEFSSSTSGGGRFGPLSLLEQALHSDGSSR